MLVELRRRFAALTPRERDVMRHVVNGRLNKQIAGDLNLSEARVKALRGEVMRTMQADSLPELVRMADRLGIATARAGGSANLDVGPLETDVARANTKVSRDVRKRSAFATNACLASPARAA